MSRKSEKKTTRPEGVTDAHLIYLDKLRESGVTNMFGAGPYLEAEFHLERKDAGHIVGYWMTTFGNEER